MSKAEKKPKVDVSARLLNLTCALLSSPHGFTKAELLSTVEGYRENYPPKDKKAEEAQNKLFERDKSILREMGVTIETRNPLGESTNNQAARYVIPSDTFVWPEAVELSSRQLNLLNLAAEVWSKASLSADASKGLVRLQALGAAPQDSDIIGFAPRIQTLEPSFEALAEAMDERRVVTFWYRKPGSDTPELRTVQPWSLQNIDGQWLLVTFDEDREAQRNFLLKRITSKVKKTEFVFEQVEPEWLEEALDELNALTRKQQAVFKVKRDSQAWFHFECDLATGPNPDEVTKHYMDLHLLADELREFIFDVTVISPDSLKDAVRSGLERVASAHA